jgi:HSP20 family molecular chaperone IbpA
MRMNTLSPFWDLTSDRSLSSGWSISPLDSLMAGMTSIEMREREDALVVTAYVPGMRPQDIDVTVTPTSLTLSGQQQQQYGQGYSYAVGYRQFEQTMLLPIRIRDHQTQVAFSSDRLVITLPKAGHLRWRVFQNLAPNITTVQERRLVNKIRYYRHQLTQGWRQIRHWLGGQLQKAGNFLLENN